MSNLFNAFIANSLKIFLQKLFFENRLFLKVYVIIVPPHDVLV